MQSWMWITGVIVIIILIVWPWFFFILLAVLLALLGLWLRHTHGFIPTFWVWGHNANTEVIVKWWENSPRQVRLEYRQNRSTNSWESVEDCFDETQLHPNDTINVPFNSRHRFQITNLVPDTVYEYRLRDLTAKKIFHPNHHATFYTQSSQNHPFRFVACGDMQLEDRLAIIEGFSMRKAMGEHPQFILFMGDHVGRYKNLALWEAFFRVLRSVFVRIPWYPVVGNHCGGEDGGFTVGTTMMLCPDNDWNYTWHYGPLYFVSVNSLPLLFQEWDKVHETETWLQNCFDNRPPECSFTIVTMHVPWIGPPYATNGEVSFYETYLEEHWKPLFEQNQVDAVFSGHKHAYIRDHQYFVTASIHGVRHYPQDHLPDYVVFNGHHYVIVDVEANKLRIQAKRWNGKVIDTTTIEAHNLNN